MQQFSNMDAGRKPQKLHIRWEMETPADDTPDRPDERDDGFWPSTDPKAAGYVDPENFDEEQRKARERMDRWEAEDWWYVGVVAVANLLVPIGGGSFRIMTLKSGGLWGIESDCGDYIREVFEDEKDNLLAELKTLGEALASGDYIQEDA
jgi:hypothetical protein